MGQGQDRWRQSEGGSLINQWVMGGMCEDKRRAGGGGIKLFWLWNEKKKKTDAEKSGSVIAATYCHCYYYLWPRGLRRGLTVCLHVHRPHGSNAETNFPLRDRWRNKVQFIFILRYALLPPSTVTKCLLTGELLGLCRIIKAAVWTCSIWKTGWDNLFYDLALYE